MTISTIDSHVSTLLERILVILVNESMDYSPGSIIEIVNIGHISLFNSLVFLIKRCPIKSRIVIGLRRVGVIRWRSILSKHPLNERFVFVNVDIYHVSAEKS